MLTAIISKFVSNRQGTIAVIVAIVAAPMMLAVGITIDYAMLNSERSRLQEITDSAALAGAAEFALFNTSKKTIGEVVEAFILAEGSKLIPKILIDEKTQAVEVSVSKYWKPMLIQYFSKTALPIVATAKASSVGSNNLCILALDDVASASLSIEGESSISAQSCSIYSNSGSVKGIAVAGKAKLLAQSICSAGGYSGFASSVKPAPVVDCPRVPDPLIGRSFQTNGNCDYKKTVIAGGKAVLQPGNYCFGLYITGGAQVELQPGLYNFSMGPLIVDGDSKISGKYVTLQFSGNKTGLELTNESNIEFKAMKTGPTAGMIILAGENVDSDTVFKIHSQDAKEFTGLVYLPDNKVEIGAETDEGDKCSIATRKHKGNPNCKHCVSNIGEFSDWTAIVSKNIEINDGVNLVMNANYESSDVPLPVGIGSSGGRLILVK